jgi:CO dehydrogenase nickel-insertion accessory protein CooC1
MASARRTDVAEVTDMMDVLPAQPKMVVTHGRGGTGKSTGVRILKERADEAGRPVVIADADRTNATLGAFYEPGLECQSFAMAIVYSLARDHRARHKDRC